MHWLVGVLLVAHGLAHLAVWAPGPRPPEVKEPFDPAHSWLIGEHPALAISLAWLACVFLAVSGVALIAGASWWGPLAIGGSLASMVLIGFFFNPWLLFGASIDLGLIAGVILLA